MKIENFGHLKDGRESHLYTLESSGGLTVAISDYGAIVVRLFAPDRKGEFADVALGFNTLSEYEEHSPYFGAIVGRVANRIANGKFTLNGKRYSVPTNSKAGGIPCSLHGGKRGFDKVLWTATPKTVKGEPALLLTYTSPDGEEGYPGNLQVEVEYQLTRENELRIEMSATTDQSTPVNLSNHSYFNLKGEGHGDALDHEVTIYAQHFTPVTAGMIPTGELREVANTPFDFRTSHRVGDRIDGRDDQLILGGGYDHNWILDTGGVEPKLATTTYEPSSGRTMDIFTTEPGVQFYAGNFLNGTLTGKSGRKYVHRGAVVFETQHFPDSVNHPEFPSTILRPGETYRSTTIYRFSAH